MTRSSSQFCSPDRLESGEPQPSRSHAGDGDWQGIVEESPEDYSWDLGTTLLKRSIFFGYDSLVGQQENQSNCGYDFDFLHSL